MSIRPRVRQATIVLGTVLLVCALATAASACPTCKDAVAANDPNYKASVAGYFYSILFMMSMPYLTICGFGTYMYLLVRRARKNAEANGAPGQELPGQGTPSDSIDGDTTPRS